MTIPNPRQVLLFTGCHALGLNYFKYFFLRLLKIPLMNRPWKTISAAWWIFCRRSFGLFLFRDFQTANIMVMEDEPYFIDFQGGRRGLLQYDPASLLYDAKSYLPRNSRTELLEYYVSLLETKADVRAGDFLHYFHSAVLLRLMQALAAFGFRGGGTETGF